MSHVPYWAAWPQECYEQCNLINDTEPNRYTGRGVLGSSVEIRGFIVPKPNLHIVWRQNGKLKGERKLTDKEHVKVMRAVADGKFAFSETGPLDQFYLELVPVEYDHIYEEMRPNWAWRGKWEVA